MTRVRLHAAVYRHDLREAFAYYRDRGQDLPARMASDFDARVDGIERHPLAGRVLFGSYRRVVLRHFPYLIAYVASDDDVLVLALLHIRRSPESLAAVIAAR